MSPLAPRMARRGARTARARTRARPGLLRPAAQFWSSVLPPVLDSINESRTQRLKTSARFQRARLDRRIAGLRALEQGLEEMEEPQSPTDPSTPVEDPYGTTVDGESQVPVPAEPEPPVTVPETPAEPPAPSTCTPPPATPPAPSTSTPPPTTTPETPAPAAAPSTRAFFEVFDALKSTDFTEDHFPKTSVVNDLLEDAGEPRTTRDVMRPVFDRWIHDRIEEGRLTPPTPVAPTPAAPAALKPVTDEVLFAAFDDLDSNDYTKDEPRYPLVKQVHESLPPGYELPTQAVIHAAYDRYPRKKDD